MIERGLDHAKQQTVIARRRAPTVSETQDPGLDFGRRKKCTLVDRKKILGLKESLGQYGGDAVDLVAVQGTNSLGNLSLKHPDAFPDLLVVFQDFEDNFGADMVRKIPDHPPTGLIGLIRAGCWGPTKKITHHLLLLGDLMRQEVLNGFLVHFGEP